MQLQKLGQHFVPKQDRKSVSVDLSTDNRLKFASDDTGQVGVWGFWAEVRQRKGFSPGGLKQGYFSLL